VCCLLASGARAMLDLVIVGVGRGVLDNGHVNSLLLSSSTKLHTKAPIQKLTGNWAEQVKRSLVSSFWLHRAVPSALAKV
jgi:hypothetical protein